MSQAMEVLSLYEEIMKSTKPPDGWFELRANKPMFKSFEINFTVFKNEVFDVFKNNKVLFSVETNADTKRVIDRVKYYGEFRKLLCSNRFTAFNYRGITVVLGVVPFGEILLVSPLDVENLLKMK